MKKFFVVSGKTLSVLLLSLVAVLALFSVSPVYDFSAPRPFSGPDIFNPYAALGRDKTWKRANFHTHTRVRSLLNECDFWPGEVLAYYDSLGYGIVTFSNHNALTVHPYDTALQVNVYEHGYNLFKYHLLVFGSDRVNRFDPLLPVLVSQRQWKLDLLGRDSDFIQLNHPFRTWLTSRDDMECLSGYEIMELDSGVTTEQEYWDWALSAGHYSFALANDDLHHPDRSWCIGIRSNMLYCVDGSYASLKETLLGGCYYCMRAPNIVDCVPDDGAAAVSGVSGGDASRDGIATEEWVRRKRDKLAAAPALVSAGVAGDTVFVKFSTTASLIKAVGQGGRVLASAENVSALRYAMTSDDTYARFTAYFDDGAVIYTNPFARYDRAAVEANGDAGISSRPALPGSYFHTPHSVNWPLTILWNLLVLAIAALSICGIARLWRLRRSP